MEPKSVQRHSDVLNCLLNMCHLQAMVTHVDGLISRIPQYKKTWGMQGLQAAWRIGRWHLMEEYLSSSEHNASFDMYFAKILLAMMKKDHSSVGLQIGLSKQALVASLAAAGMDSYMRAYPFIVKLNLLQKLEDFDALLDNDYGKVGKSTKIHSTITLCKRATFGSPETGTWCSSWELLDSVCKALSNGWSLRDCKPSNSRSSGFQCS
ncbi:hypothetical protein Dsin_012540 [Dipteronia sinensis]|uniref:PIK-related kinase FAT domain-containing protein n=1 Tax=Dipteronia sinensis TaxID=43782 RepID=A0AAE0AIY4_9ROSI|nr:hypothetical protein Dsin_012540 [Dipteronia sinensis]